MKAKLTVIAVLGLAAVLSGCVPPKPQAPPAPQTATVSYRQPAVSPIEGTTEVQDKDGVSIAVSTVPFVASETVCKQYKQLPTMFVVNNQYNYQMVATPKYRVEPDALRFKIRVVNNLSQVLRLAGTLLRFQVNGQETSLSDNSGAKALLDGVLAPREQRDYEITGPKTDKIPDSANVALMLYGIVTATDPAGNPSKRSNFEWFYKLKNEDVTKTATLTVETVQARPEDVPSSGACGD